MTKHKCLACQPFTPSNPKHSPLGILRLSPLTAYLTTLLKHPLYACGDTVCAYVWIAVTDLLKIFDLNEIITWIFLINSSFFLGHIRILIKYICRYQFYVAPGVHHIKVGLLVIS